MDEPTRQVIIERAAYLKKISPSMSIRDLRKKCNVSEEIYQRLLAKVVAKRRKHMLRRYKTTKLTIEMTAIEREGLVQVVSSKEKRAALIRDENYSQPVADIVVNDYRDRDALLKALGYRSYEKYIQSAFWKRIRSRVLKRDNLCRICRKQATQVHHQSYDYLTMVGKNDSALVSVCDHCHTKIEFKLVRRKRRKRSFADSVATCNKLLHGNTE